MLIQGREKLLEYARKIRSVLYRFHNRILLHNRLNYVKAFCKRSLEGKPEGSVVLIVVDCLRYRNTSYSGYNRRTTPFLDQFSIKMKAYATSSHTYSSVPSILTGLYPHNHGAIIRGLIKDMYLQKNYSPLRKNVVTLPEILKVFGYDIIFITTIYPVVMPFRNNVIFYKDLGKVNAGKVLEEAFKQIRRSIKRGRKFIAYIHLGDLHEPLRPPKEFADFFGEVKPLPNIERWAYRRPEEQSGNGFEEYKYNRILLYDNTLRYVDTVIKDFVSRLKDEVNGPLLVVVTADHGEEYWEHADVESRYFYHPHGVSGVAHGHNLFNELIEVPLVLQEFNSNKLKEVKERLTSLVDVVPTILDWLDLKFDQRIFDGYSLLKGASRSRYVISEAIAYGYEKKVLIKGKYKLLYSEILKVIR